MAGSGPTVLYVTRHYLSTSAAAGMRAERFVGGLLRAGVKVIVVTIGARVGLEEISPNHIVCTITEAGDLPTVMAGDKLRRWPWWELLPGPAPDSRCAKAIYRAGQWLIDRYEPSVIFATALPFGYLVIGHRLAQQGGQSLILELRDAWFTGSQWPYGSVWQRRRARRWEQRCVADADHIVAETEEQKQILERQYDLDGSGKVVTIRHGFDRAALGASPGGATEEQGLTIAYTGQLRGINIVAEGWWDRGLRWGGPLLKRVFLGANFCERLRLDWMSPHYLMEALAEVLRERPGWAKRVRLVFVGEKFDEVDRWAQEMGLGDNVRQLGVAPLAEAQQVARNADVLVLTLYGIKGLDYHWCVPGKTYTYLGCGKAILALLPPGEADDLVKRSGSGFGARPDDVAGIRDQLVRLIEQHESGGINIKPDWDFINQFEIGHAQKQFVDMIRGVVEQRARGTADRK